MRAIISGQAGVAVLCDAKPLFAVAFDAPGEKLPCATWADARALFAGADDVIDLADTTLERAVEELDLAWARDRAMQLTLVLLDGTTKADTRAEAVECVGELFAEPIAGRSGAVEEFVVNRLFSAPFPVGKSDLPGAIVIAKTADPTGTVLALLRKVETAQPRIEQLHRAWADLPLALFGDAKGAEGVEKLRGVKTQAESVLIAIGAFRKLSEAQGAALRSAVGECTALAAERDIPPTIVTEWAQALPSPGAIASPSLHDEKEEGCDMPLSEVVAQCVADRTGRRVRNLVVEVADSGGSVILRGRTNSFHIKQLAQQVVREALPKAEVENVIIVE